MTHDDIILLTLEYGSEWGINHSKRLIRLVSIIAEDKAYNEEAIWLAAYLHDWGGYQKWIVPGVEHYTRSREVAEEFLTTHSYPNDLKLLVLECIEYHHGGDPNRSFESRLFTDADALDLLGVVGTLRCFAMSPRSLKGGYVIAQKFRDMSIAAITLDKTKELAAIRIEETDQLLEKFEEETFGIF